VTAEVGADWTTAWSAALDELELTLVQTERLLAGNPGDPGDDAAAAAVPWSAPELAAPLPPELLERAQLLLARQQQLITATSAAMSGNRRSSAFLGRVTDVTGVRRQGHAIYLDVRA
jgi:hypothetical protein